MIHDSESPIEQALANLLRPGMSVYVPGSSGEPTAALEMLARFPERCTDIHFITSFVPGINTFDLSRLGRNCRFTSFFMHPSLRQAQTDGRLKVLELAYSEISAWLEEQRLDIALCQLSAETRSGKASLGPAVEFTPQVLRRAKTRVAVQNQRTPWLQGSVGYPLAEFDLSLTGDVALPEYAEPPMNELYTRIGKSVADLLPNGATLQTGLGMAPAAVLNALTAHRGIKLYSGVFSESLLRLFDSGTLSCIDSVITGVAVGGAGFYQRLSEFAAIRYAEVKETHSQDRLAAIDQFYSINSAIEVDLQGNLNAEFLDGNRISGRGGLPDFTRAGHASRSGASIIVLPSTDGSGTKSRIVRQLQSPATVSGEQVDYVITEFGCAELRGKSFKQRQAALLSIMAPALRKQLSAELRD